MYSARWRFARTESAKTCSDRYSNFSCSASSCANDLTTWTPTMFSSATVATSAIFCCTSRSKGCDTWLYRYASAIRMGEIAIETSASFHEITNTKIPTPTTVKAFWKKKIRP